MKVSGNQVFRDGVASISAPLQSALDVIERWARDAYVVCGKPCTQEGFEAAWKAEDADAYATWVAGRAFLSAAEPAIPALQPAAQQEAAYAELPDEREMLKHALWLASSFTVHRYLLMSNAEGCWSGAEKATCHDELCCLYVAVFRGVEVDRVRVDFEEDWAAVHDATQELTDHMDVVIGFPLKGVPDYESLAPKFFDHFHRLATHALRASHWQASAAPKGDIDE